MIEILSKDDLGKINDSILREGVLREFDRLPDDYVYPEYGYFIVIEDEKELELPIALSCGSREYIPLQFYAYVEMLEEFEWYQQIILVSEGGFGVSLFVNDGVSI